MFEKPTIVDVDLDTRAQSFSLDLDEVDEEIGHLTLSLSENQREVEGYSTAIDQLEDLAANLEQIHEVLASAYDGASTLTLKVAHLRVSSATTKMGLSTESIDGNLDRRAQTTLTMEKIGETIKLIGQKIVEMVKYIWEMFLKFIKYIFDFFDSTEEKAKKMKARAEQLKKEGAKIGILDQAPKSSLYNKFQIEGKYTPPTKVLAAGSLSDRALKFFAGTKPSIEAILQEVESGRIFDPAQLSRLSMAVAGSAAQYKVLGGKQTDKNGESILLITDVPGNREMEVHVPSGNASSLGNQITQFTKLSMVVRPLKQTYPPTTRIERMTLDDIITVADQVLKIKGEIDNQKTRIEKLGKAKDVATRAAQRAASLPGNDNDNRKKHVAGAASYLKRLLLNEMVVLKLQQTLITDALKLSDIYLKMYGKGTKAPTPT